MAPAPISALEPDLHEAWESGGQPERERGRGEAVGGEAEDPEGREGGHRGGDRGQAVLVEVEHLEGRQRRQLKKKKEKMKHDNE